MSDASKHSPELAIEHLAQRGGEDEPETPTRKSNRRWLALLLLLVPMLAPAPWKAWKNGTGDSTPANAPPIVETAASPATPAALVIQPATGALAAAGHVGAFLPGNAEGASNAAVAGAGMPDRGMRNARFGGAQPAYRGTGGGLPSNASTGFPPLSRLAVVPPWPSFAPGAIDLPAESDAPGGEAPADTGVQAPAAAEPGTRAEPVIGPVAAAMPLPEDQVVGELVPLRNTFPGDPAPGGPAALDPLPEGVGEDLVAITAVAAPGTGFLILIAVPLLLAFCRIVPRRT